MHIETATTTPGNDEQTATTTTSFTDLYNLYEIIGKYEYDVFPPPGFQ